MMKNSNLTLVFSMLLFAGILAPAYAQLSDNVVINEIDTNPPGNDSLSISEWVELYNPTSSDVDLSGWQVASTTALQKTLTIPSGTTISPGQFLTYSYQSIWFTDANESVELLDENDIVIDRTPTLSDIKNNFISWQRLYDGYDSDSPDDWKFVTSTAGASNGKLVEAQASDDVTVTVSSKQPSYLFGDVAVVTGSVSKEIYIVKPFFQPEQIIISISGPDFNKVITLYPDLNLNYEATLNLQQVLGINEGTYDVSVTYAGTTSETSFSVGYEIIKPESKVEKDISILTDKSQYLPGQTVSLTGFASEIIPFQGMSFSVINPEGKPINTGNLFPTDGVFSTFFYITNINPAYGIYEIIGKYSDTSTTTTFEVVEDIKEDVPISIWIDKPSYAIGDTVVINGRLNQVWIDTMDLEIIQTKQSSLDNLGSDSGFKILDSIRIKGDGSFNYSFTIPNASVRLGDYKITVSKDIGSATIIAHAVDDPKTFVVSDEPVTVQTDLDTYEFTDTITISGFVRDPFSNSSYSTGSSVSISILHEDGTPLESTGHTRNVIKTSDYVFTAIPETSGKYSVQTVVIKNIFTVGNYIVKAQYMSDTSTSAFSIVDSLALTDGAIISIDKDIYGLGETVHLTGIIPPTGDHSVSISVTRPDGTRADYGASVNKQRFSWDWTVPVFEKDITLKEDDGRDVRTSNYGIYKILVSTSSKNIETFFKVSADPENDSLSTSPLFVSTEKSLYKAGETIKVTGNVLQRQQGNEGLVVQERVNLKILDGTFPFKSIHESNVYPNQGGEFTSTFDLPPTIFDEGPYTVRASYINSYSESTFSVANDYEFGSNVDLSLLSSTDKSEYYPGDTVVISGKPSKLIYLETFEISIIKKAETEIDCGSFHCGTNTGPVTYVSPGPSGSFTHQFVIPDEPSSVGSYGVTVNAHFDVASFTFDVVKKPDSSKPNTVVVKENSISERVIPIFTEGMTGDDDDDTVLSPRVISGSLITSRGDESNVNLKISTLTGTCIIGPDADCLVRESTRKQGQIYDVVDADGISLNVRYGGSDVRIEKFSILPESSAAFLPDTTWNVEVIKDDQVSRFYYKITYKTLE